MWIKCFTTHYSDHPSEKDLITAINILKDVIAIRYFSIIKYYDTLRLSIPSDLLSQSLPFVRQNALQNLFTRLGQT